MNTILIIDDSTENLSVLYELLIKSGYKILSTSDSYKAIKIATTALPQLILLDILMPNIDGFGVCQQLKSNPTTENIPIIFITCMTESHHKIKGFNLGAADYITKPIQAEELLARVASHIKIRQLQEQLQDRNRQLEAQVKKT